MTWGKSTVVPSGFLNFMVGSTVAKTGPRVERYNGAGKRRMDSFQGILDGISDLLDKFLHHYPLTSSSLALQIQSPDTLSPEISSE